MTEKQEGVEIDLKRLFFALLRRAWILVLVGVLFATVAFCYSKFFMTPMYSANAKLYVNNTYGMGTEGFSSSQIQAAQELADTYMVILESRQVLEEVKEITGLNYSYGQLTGMISASSVNETEVFMVKVTCANYKHAAMIANAVADVLPDQIAAIVDGSSVRVVDYAVENPTKVSPNNTRNAIMGFLIGFVLSAAVVVVIDLLDESISSEEYLARVYPEVPLLAVIPDSEGSGGYGRYYKGYYVSERSKTPVPPTATGGDRK